MGARESVSAIANSFPGPWAMVKSKRTILSLNLWILSGKSLVVCNVIFTTSIYFSLLLQRIE